jgi:hypothetical protein
MENFDRIWGLVAVIIPLVMGVVTIVVQAIDKPNVTTMWGKAQLIIGRVFSFSTFRNAGNQEGFEAKLPLLQTANRKKR